MDYLELKYVRARLDDSRDIHVIGKCVTPAGCYGGSFNIGFHEESCRCTIESHVVDRETLIAWLETHGDRACVKFTIEGAECGWITADEAKIVECKFWLDERASS